MCVCVGMYVRVWVYVCMWECMCVCVCGNVCGYVCMWECMCVCEYMCVCGNVYVCVCVGIFVCVGMYVCVWVYVRVLFSTTLFTSQDDAHCMSFHPDGGSIAVGDSRGRVSVVDVTSHNVVEHFSANGQQQNVGGDVYEANVSDRIECIIYSPGEEGRAF